MPSPLPAIGTNSPSQVSTRFTHVGQQSPDTGESFPPVWNRAVKPAPGASAASTKRSDASAPTLASSGAIVRTPGPATKREDSAPVVLAADLAPQPQGPTLAKKTPESLMAQPLTTAPPSQPTVLFEAFALPERAEPAAPSAPDVPSTSGDTPMNSVRDDEQTSADLGALVFQLSLDSPDTSKRQPTQAGGSQQEVPAFQSLEEPSTTSARSDSPDLEAKQQNQEQSPASPQPAPVPTDSIASEFGFQTPVSYAAHTLEPRVENAPAAASTRTVENVSNPDPPVARSVDRIGLTLRGADDQVVRVAVNRSGDLVQVGVHTSNTGLASQLRVSVPDLVRRLDLQGYETRVSMAQSSYSLSAPSAIASAHTQFRSGADSNGNTKSNGNLAHQDEPRQQRQRNPQRAWRELVSKMQAE
jgi:hypothetical protein